jgi:hypothetical protein
MIKMQHKKHSFFLRLSYIYNDAKSMVSMHFLVIMKFLKPSSFYCGYATFSSVSAQSIQNNKGF